MIHIAFGINDAFAMPCGVLMASILKVMHQSKIVFHIIAERILDRNQKLLRETIDGTNAQLVFYFLSDSDSLKNLPILGHFGKEMYFRFF
ncbi:MAG: hypothetical protein LBO80_10710, partial [Treponema sp.]|nr:hypothetical protein [Treponema sp.]